MNIRDKRNLKFLNDTAMNPGFKGFGGRRELRSMLQVPYRLTGLTIYDIPTKSGLYKEEEHAAPGGVFVAGSGVVLDEERHFYAFDIDGSNNAIAKEWTYEEIFLNASGAIHYEANHWTGSPAPNAEYFAFPLFIAVYPILDPWVVPQVQLGGTLLPEWVTPPVWANQPFTTFDQNLAGGANNGFTNPLTGVVDNFMGLNLVLSDQRFSTFGLNQSTYANQFIGGSIGNYNVRGYFDRTGTGWAVMQNSSATINSIGNQGIRIPITEIPSGQIYGIGIYIMTLNDINLQQIYEGWTDAYVWLLSANNPGYTSCFDNLLLKSMVDDLRRASLDDILFANSNKSLGGYDWANNPYNVLKTGLIAVNPKNDDSNVYTDTHFMRRKSTLL